MEKEDIEKILTYISDMNKQQQETILRMHENNMISAKIIEQNEKLITYIMDAWTREKEERKLIRERKTEMTDRIIELINHMSANIVSEVIKLCNQKKTKDNDVGKE